MSVRLLIATYLWILCAVATGCGTSAEPKSDRESLAAARNAAPPRKNPEEEAADKKADDEKAAEKKADEQKAAEKKVAEEKAAANSYVKVKVEVELRGVLTCTDEAATLSIVTPKPKFGNDPFEEAKGFEEVKWVLDFGEEKEIRAKAKSLDGKTVMVTGSAILRGIKSETGQHWVGGGPWTDQNVLEHRPPAGAVEKLVTRSVLDLEPKVAVKSLVEAKKD